MEASSHALALHRVDGTRFAAAVFTNLGTDHLDLHGTPEAYFRAKARLFTPELAAVGVTNVDDAHGRLLLDAAPIEMVPYSLADATDVVVTADHHELTWRGARLVVGFGGALQRRQHARRGDDGRRARHRRRTSSPPGSPRPAACPGASSGSAATGDGGAASWRSSTTPTRPTGWRRSSPRRGRSPPAG